MNKNVYVSCSWTFPTLLKESKKLLEVQGFKTTSNGKHETYDASKIQKASFVVFVFENWGWSMALENMSSGMLKELVWCINNRKPIFVLYKSSITRDVKPYAAEITSDLILQGQQGTSPNMDMLSTIDTGVLCSYNEAGAWVKSLTDTPVVGFSVEPVIDYLKQSNSYFY